MKDISIYKSSDNCLGGNIDITIKDNIFDLLVDSKSLACLYIKNTTPSNKKILKLNVEGPEIIELGIKVINNEIVLNTLEPTLTAGLPLNVVFTNVEFPNVVLKPGEFFTLWLYKPPAVTPSYSLQERNTCLMVEWVDN